MRCRTAILATLLLASLAGTTLVAEAPVAGATSQAGLDGGGRGRDPELAVGGSAHDDDISAVFSTAPDGRHLTLHDPGGMVGCTAVDPFTVACDGIESLPMYGDTGDDRLRATAESGTQAIVEMDGGPGNDTLTTGPGVRATFRLSDGDDRIEAGDESELDVGGYGNPALRGPFAVYLGPGVVTNGPYRTTFSGITSLHVVSPAHVEGGPGADHIEMDWPGDVDGAGGDDVISGRGTLRGGAGNDLIVAGSGSTVSCGSGQDTVDTREPGSTIGRDCERLPLYVYGYTVDPRLPRSIRRSNRVHLQIQCAATVCTGRVRLSLRGRKTTVRYRIAPNVTRTLTLRVPGGHAVHFGSLLHIEVAPGSAPWHPWIATVTR